MMACARTSLESSSSLVLAVLSCLWLFLPLFVVPLVVFVVIVVVAVVVAGLAGLLLSLSSGAEVEAETSSLASLSFSRVAVVVVVASRLAARSLGWSFCSSSALTSRQEHFACFFVQPMHAVRFLRQCMFSLLHLSQGGRIRSPLARSSMRATMAALNGAVSSRSCEGVGFGCGSSEEGVLGIGTGGIEELTCPGNGEEEDWWSESGWWSGCCCFCWCMRLSEVVKNFFMSSARVLGEAPLIEVPLMMVTLSEMGWEKANCAGSSW